MEVEHRPAAFAGRERFKIPSAMNAGVLTLQLVAVVACFLLLPYANELPWLLALAVIFGIVMNSVYSTIHEAHHRVLFESRALNDGWGIVLSALFPAPFHLLRQGHIGHHRSNRSDDEVFDLYFDHDSRLLKTLAWYGILTGVYWLLVVFSNVVLVFAPRLMDPELYRFDRTSHVFLHHFDKRTFPMMRLEALGAMLLHVAIIWMLDVSFARYAVMYFGFGLMWSSLQYVHHYQTERHVLNGARNLHAFRLLDRIWLNHNWHQTHHQHPTIPWNYLPEVARRRGTGSDPLLPAYFRMWRGPRPAETSVRNRFGGEVSRR